MKTCLQNSFLYILVIVLFTSTINGQTKSLRENINEIIEQANGRIGAAIIGLEQNDTLTFSGNGHFPMQSVYKFPLALKMLSEIDKGKFSLDQKIHVKNEDLLPNTWSPLREKYPDGNVDITIRELLEYTISVSDNNGCDILFRLLGGPAAVNQFVKDLGIDGMSIVSTEEEMHKAWEVQYLNYSTPSAMAKLLYKFVSDSILSSTSTDFLWNVMVSTKTGQNKIKGKLPAGTVVAHKTGSSGTNKDGITAATNNVGIVVLPDGNKFIVVVFVSDSPDDENSRDAIIANITKTAWDAYLK